MQWADTPAIRELENLLLEDETVEETLRRVGDLCVTLAACDTAGISVTDRGVVSTWVATSPETERLDEHQYTTDEGPCLDAIRQGHVLEVRDAAAEDRWPSYMERARAEGLVASVSYPMIVRGRSIGALNLYSFGGPLPQADRNEVAVLAEHAAVAVANAQTYRRSRELVGHLTEALESRDVIGQAKGVLIALHSCDADEAFELLRGMSQRTNRKLRDIAAEVVASAQRRHRES
ncbi:MAG TPA: GAF and ANTAR domain-containing protein [Mycobacteriales bacterium]|nr:GAF and ANTAR domain-containing protein [Mycobacteriales bacterium]